MSKLSVKTGQILSGSLFNEPMRVETARQAGADTWVLGLVGVRSERFRSVTVTPRDLQSLSALDPTATYTGDGKLLRLGLQAYSLGIVTQFVKRQSAKAAAQGDDPRARAVGFLMSLYQHRLASSTYAMRHSLENRARRLEEGLKRAQELARLAPPDLPDPEEIEEMEETERERLEQMLEAITLAGNADEVRDEVAELKRLAADAQAVEDSGAEAKLTRLKDLLHAEGFFDQSAKRLLIFTEFKDTLDYLMACLKKWGFVVGCIHGGMKIGSRDERGSRLYSEQQFKDGDIQVLVATEAAGEGINLQCCHILFNYDIPWNPNRLEQRMGRIHRYGQKFDCLIFNFVATNTIEAFLEEVRAERFAEVERIAVHVELSLTELLQKTDEEIGRAAADVEQKLQGAEGRLAQAETRHAELLERRERRRRELERQRALSLQAVERIASALILPHPERETAEVRRLQPNFETEQTAMRVVIEYEQSLGRQVYDVHEKNLGCDLTSLDLNSGELRLIEVKSIGAKTGTVLLTPNERRVAEDRPGCYWLYVVTDCKSIATLQEPIRNPARFEWHEVKKVDHYWLEVNALTKPM